MKAITPTHYAVECNLNWLPVPRNLNQNTRSSPARVNERASGDETRAIYSTEYEFASCRNAKDQRLPAGPAINVIVISESWNATD